MYPKYLIFATFSLLPSDHVTGMVRPMLFYRLKCLLKESNGTSRFYSSAIWTGLLPSIYQRKFPVTSVGPCYRHDPTKIFPTKTFILSVKMHTEIVTEHLDFIVLLSELIRYRIFSPNFSVTSVGPCYRHDPTNIFPIKNFILSMKTLLADSNEPF